MTEYDSTGSREREAHLFQLLAENLRDHAIFTLDVEGQVESWNRGAEQLLGYAEHEVIGRPAALFFTPEDTAAGAPLQELNAALESGRACHDRWCVRKDGSRFWASTTVVPRWDAKVLRGFATILRDRMESVHESETQLRLVADRAPVLIAHCDTDTRYKFVNERYAARFGLRPAEVVGRRIADVVGEETYARFRLHVATALAGRPVEFELELPQAELGFCVLHCAYAPDFDAENRVRGIVAVITDVTERRLAEDALRESERRFAGFMRHLPGLAWIKDRDGRYVFANDAAEKAFGTPRNRLYGKTDDELFPQPTATQFRENDRRALGGVGVQTYETLTHPDGSTHHSLVSKFPIPGPDDQPTFVAGIAIDVTDLRRAEYERQFLAEAGAVLSSTLDYEVTLSAVVRLTVPRLADWCSVYLVDTGGGLRRLAAAHTEPEKVQWAEELARRYPPAPDDIRGVGGVIRSGQALLVPDITDEMLVAGARDADYLELLRKLAPRSAMIVPLVARDRTLGAVTFVVAESGRRYGEHDLELAQELARRAALAVDNARLFHDSGDTLRRLGLLVEASARLTSTLDPRAMQSAIIDLSHRLVDADAYAMWRIDAVADAWVIADSANLSESYLRNWGRIPGLDQQMPDQPIVAEDAQGSAALESRRQMYQSEGIESVLAVPLRIHGRIAGTLVFYYRKRRRIDDVTVRVASALADLAGAALGTAELYQRESELRHRAEEADHAKDAFLAALGHELRNPLNVIVTGLHALRELGAKGLDRVPGMERQANVLRQLVDDLLDMGRVTQGRIELRREPVRVADVVAQAFETTYPLIDDRRHTVTVDLPAEDVWLDADPVRLTQCISNLLHNAAKYTDPGGRIALIAAREESNVVLRVRDNGIGIPPTDLQRIFGLFEQVQDARSHSQGGLGIGLSLVKRLIAMMGGTVVAHSNGVGTGSEFVIRLPASTAPPAAAPVLPPPPPPVVAAEANGRLRVVIADDNEDAAETLAILVEMWGHAARVANDGPGAVAAACDFRPDICLFDIGMPGFDGYEAARRVRADANLNGVVLVAMTGFGQDTDRERGAAAGFDHFLVKPVAPAEVERLLRGLKAASPQH